MKNYRILKIVAFASILFGIIGIIGAVLTAVLAVATQPNANLLLQLVTAVGALFASLLFIGLSEAIGVWLATVQTVRAQSDTSARLEIKLNNLAANVDALRENIAQKPLAPTPPPALSQTSAQVDQS